MSLLPGGPNFLSVLAMPRTGSSFLEILLTNCEGIVTCGEPFNRPRSPEPLSAKRTEELRLLTNLEISDEVSWHQWKIANPGRMLDFEQSKNRNRLVTFKIFPLHLSNDLIDRDIFSRADVCYIVLRRRPIEGFISDQKAAALKAWRSINTTDIKPVLHPQKFVEWAKYYHNWYDWLSRRLAENHAPVVELSYERHLRTQDPSQAISNVLNAIESLGLGKLSYAPKYPLLERQDLEENYQARCANWDDFAAQVLKRPDGNLLMKWAETAP